MKLEYDRTGGRRGVTQLQYVGDDGLPKETPAGSILLVLLLGAAAYLAFRKK